MATITPKILKKNKKQDGTWNVVYRLTHNRKSRYIKTIHYVTQDSIVGDDDLHIDYVIDFLADEIKKYRRKISDISDIELLDVEDVKSILVDEKKDVDFIAFIQQHITKLKDQGRDKTAKPFGTVYNSLRDYVSGPLYCSKVTSKFLEEYEKYLRTPKELVRQQGSVKAIRKTSVTDKGLHNHMAAFRTLFNEAKKYYNDEDTGKIVIKNNPFFKYKIIQKKNKKHKNLSIDQIRIIRDAKTHSRIEKLAKAMFMLSFYLCGMNTVDIFNYWQLLKHKPDRLTYNRSKTRGKREDDALISILIPDEAKKIISELDLSTTNIDLLNKDISLGLISLRVRLNIPEMTLLYARHSFATIARNDLNISREDVALALNHVSQDSRITDTYLAPDWSKIDRVQEAVINELSI